MPEDVPRMRTPSKPMAPSSPFGATPMWLSVTMLLFAFCAICTAFWAADIQLYWTVLWLQMSQMFWAEPSFVFDVLPCAFTKLGS